MSSVLHEKRFEAVVIGASAGGIRALTMVLSALPEDFALPIIIVQHVHPHSGGYISHILGAKCALIVKQADEKEPVLGGRVYIAPPNYHLMLETDRSFSLSIAAPVNYSRPAIDVLFETAIDAYYDKIVCIVLTGANHDGSQGAAKIHRAGGYIIVQDPLTAEADSMPRATLAATPVDKVLPLEQIGAYLLQLINRSNQLWHFP
ncbi:MAG: hypothetical protein RIS84_308 [Pseudomonadota bacterium]|jgi:two-component system chemotaxis response regulator CheB